MAVVVVISVWRCMSRWNYMGRPSRHRWIQVGGEGGSKKSGGWNRKKINGKENRSNKKKKKD